MNRKKVKYRRVMKTYLTRYKVNSRKLSASASASACLGFQRELVAVPVLINGLYCYVYKAK